MVETSLPTPGELAATFAHERGGTPADHLVAAAEELRRRRGVPTPEAPPVSDPPVAAPRGIDFVFDTYVLPEDPTGRPTGLDLLMATTPAGTPARDGLEGLTRTLRERFGADRLVWGVKLADGRLDYELYLYGPGNVEPDQFEAFRLACDTVAPWRAPTTLPTGTVLVSVECIVDATGAVTFADVIDVYQQVPRTGDPPLLLAYTRSQDASALKNTYQMFLRPDHDRELRRRLCASRFAGPSDADRIATAWFDRLERTGGCDRVWVSAKPRCDGVYEGRVDEHALIAFLDEFGYPDHLCTWVRDRLDVLGHLRYDIGMDYVVDDGTVRVVKSGFYGWL